MSDNIGDMLTIIRNGYMAKHFKVKARYSKMNINILMVLKKEGYISEFSQQDIRTGVKRIEISLKYVDGSPSIVQIDRVSKPGMRVFSKIGDLGKFYNGLGTYVISTSAGIISDYEARKKNIGGEILCRVF